MENGWIKLHRQMAEWEWYDDTNTVRVFLHILLYTNHKTKKWHGMTIKRGEFLTSRKKLSEVLRLSQQCIRTALHRLISTNEITIQSTNQFSIIQVRNWEKYQITNQPNNQRTNKRITSDQPATNQQLTTTKKDKNIRNKDKSLSSNKFGDEEINLILTSFEKNINHIPADNYPRRVAQAIKQRINTFIKLQSDNFKVLRSEELVFDYVLDKSWTWFMAKEYSANTEKLDTFRLKMIVYLDEISKKLAEERRLYDQK